MKPLEIAMHKGGVSTSYRYSAWFEAIFNQAHLISNPNGGIKHG